jgi:ribulose-phosphate 3-epimerase
MTFQIAASILSANFAKLGEECDAVLKAGADRIHFDVMDNHYVPNLTIGPLVCRALRDYGITAPIDVHLMTKPVDSLILDFAKAGANIITFHPEASKHVDRSLSLIRDHGLKSGLALNPATPISYTDYILDKLDEVLIMSVNPGFAGQQFIPSSLEKIKLARKILPENITIAVDGGVKLNNIQAISQSGANIFILGSAIFNTNDYDKILQDLRRKLSKI